MVLVRNVLGWIVFLAGLVYAYFWYADAMRQVAELPDLVALTEALPGGILTAAVALTALGRFINADKSVGYVAGAVYVVVALGSAVLWMASNTTEDQFGVAPLIGALPANPLVISGIALAFGLALFPWDRSS